MDYHEDYNENQADDRNNSNVNANSKYHFSVVGPMIFPLNDLSQVMPATLLIYNELILDCQELDEAEGQDQLQEQQTQLSEEWHHWN